jgi:hypothetical protein
MLAIAALCVMAGGALAADSVRGRALYEMRCVECHATSVHSRTKRIAASCIEIREQVVRWSRQQGSEWTAEEVDDVTLYLNERYYAFPVRDGRCVAVVALSPLR